jgi:hypothetical protein
MNTNEKELINYFTINVNYEYTIYSFRRINERRIKDEWVRDTIYNGDIVELHYKDGDIRILKRSNKPYRSCAVCVVYSLITHNIITAYCNSFIDNHITLDASLYDDQINIVELALEKLNRAIS